MRGCDDVQFGFERLEVWQRAVDFAGYVYRITKAFPRGEMLGLTSQLRRASVSVAANIAEGSSRWSRKHQVRFLEMAYGSLNEIVTMFHIASGQELVTNEQLLEVRREASEMCRMLSGLCRSLTQSAS